MSPNEFQELCYDNFPRIFPKRFCFDGIYVERELEQKYCLLMLRCLTNLLEQARKKGYDSEFIEITDENGVLQADWDGRDERFGGIVAAFTWLAARERYSADYKTGKIELSDLDEQTMAALIQESSDKDISVNDVVSNLLYEFVQQQDN